MAENRLAQETSPYLRQHAHNPVDWYPWGPEALEKARREDRPLFLSVGYSACHWCHVMAHESFEDAETAALLNDLFVPVKVDREERPDLDALYMRAVMILHGHGGWPLSVFLTPDLKPFFGGTYFPKESRFGMTGFPDLLRALARAYRERRGDLEASAAQLVAAMARSFEAAEGERAPGPATADAARRALLARFDDEQGGFGGGPKFPQPPLLEFLLDEAARTKDPALSEKVLFTLRRMEAGGVRDQVGGGFHRYSVDGRWHVPHYEKMLYDNAQLASLYFRAGALSGDGALLRVGEEVLGDLRRTMAAPGGGFVAALDADTEGEEGRFYLWSRSELVAVLGAADGALVGDLYGVTSDGASLEERTLHRTADWREAAREAGRPEPALRERVRGALDRLREAREARVHPGVDTKVLTDWNALAATAFLDGYAATGDPSHLAVGLATLDRVESRCLSGSTLFHVWDGEAARVPGFLADYAYLARARCRALKVTGDPGHLARASALAALSLERFADARGRLFDTPPDGGGDLLLPVRDADDGVLPSAVSALAQVLWVLDRVTGETRWRQALERLLASEAGDLSQAPGARPLLAGLAALRARPSVEIVVAAASLEAAAPLLEAARRCPCPRALVLPYLADRWPAAEAERLPLLRGRRREVGAAAFVCTGGACRLPVEDVSQLAELLKEDPVRAFAEAPEN